MADDNYSLFQRSVRETPGVELSEEQLKSMYNIIKSQPHESSVLSSILNPQETFQRSFTTKQNLSGDFHSSSSGVGGLANAWIFTHLDFDAKDIKRKFSGNAWGFLPGIPAGALIGTIWYNDVNHFDGECQFFIGVALGDTQIAAFHGGNVGGAVGGTWGSGTWRK